MTAQESIPTGEPLFNPFLPGYTDDPYPHYAALRAQAPVYEHPFGFWVVSTYDEVSALLRSGTSVEMSNVAPGAEGLLLDEYADAGSPIIGGVSMLDRDPPDHTRLRKLVSKAFTPRAIAALEPRIRELTESMLDDIAAAGRVDLVPSLAFPLPFTAIAEMLGTPPTDHERIRELSGMLVRSLEPVNDPEVVKKILAADAELEGIMREMIAWKRDNPKDDLFTALIHAEEDGDRLSDEELVAQVLLLYLAGHETTVNLLSGGTLALLRHPDQMAALRADPDLVPDAVDELLRYDTPVQASRRITLEPTTIRGVEIPPGAFVMGLLGSANRDENHWGPDAGEVRVDRPGARGHVSFGAGVHHCLGASLARLEAKVVFERMPARFPDISLDGDVTWNGRINLRGPATLPVRV